MKAHNGAILLRLTFFDHQIGSLTGVGWALILKIADLDSPASYVFLDTLAVSPETPIL